jgi:hypothetical protein
MSSVLTLFLHTNTIFSSTFSARTWIELQWTNQVTLCIQSTCKNYKYKLLNIWNKTNSSTTKLTSTNKINKQIQLFIIIFVTLFACVWSHCEFSITRPNCKPTKVIRVIRAIRASKRWDARGRTEYS